MFAEELASLGVVGEGIWFPAKIPHVGRTSSMMSGGSSAVSGYVAAANAVRYRWPFLQVVLSAHSGIQFQVFGAGSESLTASKNVLLLGDVTNGAAVMRRGHVRLRPTKYDAFARTVRMR